MLSMDIPTHAQMLAIQKDEIDALRKRFSYDPETGLVWRITATGPRLIRQRLCKDGYALLSFRQKKYRVHRVAWMICHGYLHPKMQIDHIDRDRLNNRIDNNLRLSTDTLNGWNRSLSRNNTSGHTGVSFNRKNNRWIARIVVRQRSVHLGSFIEKDGAVAAYTAAKLAYHKV